jgi:hypothetical protein
VTDGNGVDTLAREATGYRDAFPLEGVSRNDERSRLRIPLVPRTRSAP